MKLLAAETKQKAMELAAALNLDLSRWEIYAFGDYISKYKRFEEVVVYFPKHNVDQYNSWFDNFVCQVVSGKPPFVF